MAKYDYYVIVYKILAYLYMRLKHGEPIDNMTEQGYIKGLHNVTAGNGYYIQGQLSGCQITPMGIDYLCENSLIERAKQFLKDMKDITPFI